ncbi:MAG: hypothetical protein HY322_02735 [Betaproteobacteria bacterium]|jgi:hypothetical protein|nr:hypothetical protein [Betaproteobacteria bacterium]
MDQAVGFDELHWLQELTYKTQKAEMPALIETRLLKRKLIERKDGRCSLTPRGLIALAKLA